MIVVDDGSADATAAIAREQPRRRACSRAPPTGRRPRATPGRRAARRRRCSPSWTPTALPTPGLAAAGVGRARRRRPRPGRGRRSLRRETPRALRPHACGSRTRRRCSSRPTCSSRRRPVRAARRASRAGCASPARRRAGRGHRGSGWRARRAGRCAPPSRREALVYHAVLSARRPPATSPSARGCASSRAMAAAHPRAARGLLLPRASSCNRALARRSTSRSRAAVARRGGGAARPRCAGRRALRRPLAAADARRLGPRAELPAVAGGATLAARRGRRWARLALGERPAPASAAALSRTG